jgi:DnaJ-class molecular chaperone
MAPATVASVDATCRRCGGTGKGDPNPGDPTKKDFCFGCDGGGTVNLEDPASLNKNCPRCKGTGKYTDRYIDPSGIILNNWCLRCEGCGYG